MTDIDRSNVRSLEVAWTYRHGDVRSGGVFPDKYFKATAFEATPIFVDGLLVFTTPFNRIIALDAETGKERWIFDPQIDKGRRFGNMMINRGVALWRGGSTTGHCETRLFMGTLDARLVAVDARDGKACQDFGDGGTVNLLDGIEHLVDPWEYNLTSPPTVVGDVVIVGSSIADIIRRIMPSGAVRAYDARSGKLVWRFYTIPQGSEFGSDTWAEESWRESGGANVWSTMTADLGRGAVYLPVSTAGPDLYGGDRKGANLFSDSLVALDAATGERLWHFQTVHHDLWDYDLASPPILARVRRNGADVDAVIQLTKTGLVFVLDRDTGAPLFLVEERPVPPSDVPGEEAWPTQPFPTRPPPLVPHRLTETDLWDADPDHHEECLALLRSLRNEGIFTPPSLEGSILFPGAVGGANWSGGAYSPVTELLYVPLNILPMWQRLVALPESNFEDTDARVMQGGWDGLRWAITGKGTGLRYSMMERAMLAVDGVPCSRPPWGTLSAVDPSSGDIRWQVPVGEDVDGVRGLANLCPPLVTGSGLIFHGGSSDQRLWVYDAETGNVVTKFTLPAGLHAGPITYQLRDGGKQFLVVAPGGHRILDTEQGDYVIAYALPGGEQP